MAEPIEVRERRELRDLPDPTNGVEYFIHHASY